MQPRRIASHVIDRVKAMEMATLLFFAIFAGGLFLFAQLTGEVIEGDTHALDEAILLALRQPGDLSIPIGPSWLSHAMDDITSLGGITVLSIMTALATTYLILSRRRKIAAFMLFSVAGGWATSTLLKIIIARPRPEIVPHLVNVQDLSFPSGHAMLSAVTYLTLGALLSRAQSTRATRLFMIGSALFLTLIIGLSRIFLGVHYPTDVLGGWCAGASWAVGCWLVARRYVSALPSADEPQETPTLPSRKGIENASPGS